MSVCMYILMLPFSGSEKVDVFQPVMITDGATSAGLTGSETRHFNNFGNIWKCLILIKVEKSFFGI